MKTKIIPSGWWEIKLLDICEIYQPMTISQKDMVKDGKYLVYGANGVIGRHDNFNHEYGEVLVTCRGATCGTLNFSKPKSWITGNAMVISPKNNSLSKKFLYGVLTRMNLKKLVSGSAQPQITRLSFNGFKILVPPIKEQEKIAKILTSVDNIIELTEKSIEKNEKVKKGLMNELLIRGIGHKEFKKVKIGFKEVEIPVGWEVKKLEDTILLKARIGWQGLSQKEYLKEGKFLLITANEFSKNSILWDKCFFVDEERYNLDKNIKFKENDVLVTKDGTIGRIAFLENLKGKIGTLGSGIFVLRSKINNLIQRYIFNILESSIFSDFVKIIKSGSTIIHLYQRDFNNFSFPLPPLPEQKTISKILQTQDNLIQLEKQSLTKLKQIKKGLMQKLLIGKIRVKI